MIPSRAFTHDSECAPAIVDRAALRDAIEALGGDPQLINPLCPAYSANRVRSSATPSPEFERSP